jgi:hypothetical protein
MDLPAFIASLQTPRPPAKLPPLLLALWKEARGEWDAAHHIAQDIGTLDAARVHAYLHRKEGDRDNADYWYRKAGRTPHSGPLDDEWRDLVRDLLRA